MIHKYKKEEIIHSEKIPAKISYQNLKGNECFCPLHWHKDFEINFVLKNVAEFVVNGKTKIVMPGDFIFINSSDLHAGNGDFEKILSERSQELLTIQIDYQFFKFYFDTDCPIRFTDKITLEDSNEIKKNLLSIYHIILHKKPYYEMKIHAHLLEIGSILLSNYVTHDTSYSLLEDRTFRQIKKVIDFMEENYMENLDLTTVANKMGWQESYFSRKFKQLTGINFHEYLVSIRLKHAENDLLHTELDMTTISYDNGFPNVKSFIQSFKKAYGVTPLQYRKESIG